MKVLLAFNSRVGVFYIVQSKDGRFHPYFNEEMLGSYEEIFQAIDDLANDHVGSVLHPETGELLDLSELEIPEDYGEWERVTNFY